jgi:ATP-dependent protease ClpP protease subunit
MKSKTNEIENMDEVVGIDDKIMYESVTESKEFHVYIYDDIGPVSKYIPVLHSLNSSKPGDVFHFHINSYGGDVTAGLQLINAMNSSPAHIVTHLEATAYSMAALIFMVGDEQRVYPNSMLMFHNYSSAVFGKGHEQKAQLQATTKWFHDLIYDTCSPLLDEDELARITDGEDIWLTSSQILERIDKMKPSVTETENGADDDTK